MLYVRVRKFVDKALHQTQRISARRWGERYTLLAGETGGEPGRRLPSGCGRFCGQLTTLCPTTFYGFRDALAALAWANLCHRTHLADCETNQQGQRLNSDSLKRDTPVRHFHIHELSFQG